MSQFNLLEPQPDSPEFINSDEATTNTLRFVLSQNQRDCKGMVPNALSGCVRRRRMI